MNAKRLKELEKFAQEDPTDPFIIYALALEYSLIDPDKAKTLFAKLITQHENYLPTYYTYACFLSDTGEEEYAKKIASSGIAVARTLSNQKALHELTFLLEQLTG